MGSAGPHDAGTVPSTALQVSCEEVFHFRAAQSHLGNRLPPGSFRDAAWGALQDSSPRAALLSLHARLEGVGPGSWEDPALWQIWLRMADYVVPRQDFGVFTLGALPRAPGPASALVAVGEAVREIVGDQSLPSRDVAAALARRPNLDDRTRHHPRWVMQEACVSGRYRIRWDARTVAVMAAPVPDVDPEEARQELARRFLHWHGPATPRQFASWAHLPLVDAVETWRVLAPELLPVAAGGELRQVLVRDEERLRQALPVASVRLVPFSDPVFALDRNLLFPAADGAGPSRDERGSPVTPRLRNSLTGRVLVDGVAVGSWGRREHQLLIWLWEPADPAVRERVTAEAATFGGPAGRPVEIRWLT